MKICFNILVMILGISCYSQEFSDFKIIGKKNIFNPNRGQLETQIQISNTNFVSFFLRGTMSYKGESFAYFDSTEKIYQKSLKINDSIAGFKVSDIQSSFVILSYKTNVYKMRVDWDSPTNSMMIKYEDGDWRMNYPSPKGDGFPLSSNSFGVVQRLLRVVPTLVF